MRHNIPEGAKYAFDILFNFEWTEFLKKKALNCILHFNKDEETAKFLLNNVDKQFRWYVFDSIDEYTDLLITELNKILNKDEDIQKIRAAKRLIKLNQLNGLDYVVNLIISSKSATIYHFHDYNINSFTNQDALPILYRLIEVCYTNDFTDAPFYSIKHDVITIIKNIIVNNDNLDEVINELNKIIENKKTTIPEITNINYSIKDITNFYNQVKSENISIDEAIKLVNELN